VEAGGAAAGHIEGWLVDSHGWRVSYAVVKATAGAARKHLLLPVSPLGHQMGGRAIHLNASRGHRPRTGLSTRRTARRGLQARLRGFTARIRDRNAQRADKGPPETESDHGRRG
jgi:hypothetical protein